MKLNKHPYFDIFKDRELLKQWCVTNKWYPETPFFYEPGNRLYYITNTVLDNMKLFDAKKALTENGWQVFKTLPDFKKTLLLDVGKGHFYHLVKKDDILYICVINNMSKYKDMDGDWTNFNIIHTTINLNDNTFTHFNEVTADSKPIEDYLRQQVYSLLCFLEFSEIEEIELKPKNKYGNWKSGAPILNNSNEPVIIVNNKWNVKTTRTEGFPVSGHFRLQRIGANREQVKLIYIEPFMKEGYTRRSGKELNSK